MRQESKLDCSKSSQYKLCTASPIKLYNERVSRTGSVFPISTGYNLIDKPVQSLYRLVLQSRPHFDSCCNRLPGDVRVIVADKEDILSRLVFPVPTGTCERFTFGNFLYKKGDIQSRVARPFTLRKRRAAGGASTASSGAGARKAGASEGTGTRGTGRRRGCATRHPPVCGGGRATRRVAGDASAWRGS